MFSPAHQCNDQFVISLLYFWLLIFFCQNIGLRTCICCVILVPPVHMMSFQHQFYPEQSVQGNSHSSAGKKEIWHGNNQMKLTTGSGFVDVFVAGLVDVFVAGFVDVFVAGLETVEGSFTT